jgi:hypothetical protein
MVAAWQKTFFLAISGSMPICIGETVELDTDFSTGSGEGELNPMANCNRCGILSQRLFLIIRWLRNWSMGLMPLQEIQGKPA